MRMRTTKLARAAVLLSATLAGPATAGPYEDAMAAAKRGDYATAIGLWRPLADQGDRDARFLLGSMYAAGKGVPQDYAEAAKWYRLAADQGESLSQFFLGAMYSNGQGVPQDYGQAVKFYRMAAEQGDADAQYKSGA